MKFLKHSFPLDQTHVAPLVGAWIEIHVDLLDDLLIDVAPLVGAWIEIGIIHCFKLYLVVAPLVGAWIEMVVKLASI